MLLDIVDIVLLFAIECFVLHLLEIVSSSKQLKATPEHVLALGHRYKDRLFQNKKPVNSKRLVYDQLKQSVSSILPSS